MGKGKKMGGGQRSEGDVRERERGAESKGESEKEKKKEKEKGKQGRKPQNLCGAALGGSRVTSVSVKAGTCQEHTECSPQCILWPLI